MSPFEKNIYAFYVVRVTYCCVFWGSILIHFLMRVGNMTLAQLYILEAVCVVVALALQVPTGMFADRYGRVVSVKIGMWCQMFHLGVSALACDWVAVSIGNLLWAIGMAFVSGADSALLYDSLRACGRERESRKIEGRANSINHALTAILALNVGAIAGIELRLPVILDTVFVSIGVVACTWFTEPPVTKNEEKGSGGVPSVWEIISCMQTVWIILFSAVVCMVSKLWFFTYNPYFELVHLPLAWYGYVFSAMNLVSAVSGWYADRTYSLLGERGSVLWILACVSIPILVMGYTVAPWVVSMILFQNLVRGYSGPFTRQLLNERVPSEIRATVLSVGSFCAQALEVPCMCLFALVTSSTTLDAALLILGIVAVAGGIVIMILYMRFFDNVS